MNPLHVKFAGLLFGGHEVTDAAFVLLMCSLDVNPERPPEGCLIVAQFAGLFLAVVHCFLVAFQMFFIGEVHLAVFAGDFCMDFSRVVLQGLFGR